MSPVDDNANWLNNDVSQPHKPNAITVNTGEHSEDF